MNAPLVERYRDRIAGVLTCYDRVVITGTLPGACHAAEMTSFLNAQHIRIFDYPQFAEPLRDRLRANAEKLAESAGAKIEYQSTYSQGGSRRGGHQDTWRSPRVGSCHFGHGTLHVL